METSTPCFIVTRDLAHKIEQIGLGGAHFDDVSVSMSPQAEEMIGTALPEWRWMKLTGRAGESDFGLDDELYLVISDRALDLLQEAGIRNAKVAELRP
ncbi:hypothetical protein [Nocardia huaxiensis]|uniref:Uncharacterized protein n=1 Tax=Nocardia huaxiensis TaxID=2755382 RepID=A0A7D6Z0X8_9NOCA|nr:hypothetical protein [Nocardia huaxiensis]QLY29726.1 hypothetical protein H0264_31580 [Nocardia huaxiensis]UFS96695.1 hypothetical protein LPY97_01800 [Nocardia huaxiensis]